MLVHLRKRIGFLLVLGTNCLPVVSAYAQGIDIMHSAVAYNLRGNISSDNQGGRYHYNAFNQLTEDQVASTGTLSYDYYASGLQAKAYLASPSVAAQYRYYDAQGVRVNSAQGSKLSAYLFAYNVVLRSYHHANIQLYMRNRHDSVIGVLTHTSTYAKQYTVYGQSTIATRQQRADHMVNDLASNPLGYGNYPYDPVSRLYYLRARYYRPRLAAAFLSADSFVFNSTGVKYHINNGYAYGNNTPLMGLDPSGHVEVEFEGNVLSKESFIARNTVVGHEFSQDSVRFNYKHYFAYNPTTMKYERSIYVSMLPRDEVFGPICQDVWANEIMSFLSVDDAANFLYAMKILPELNVSVPLSWQHFEIKNFMGQEAQELIVGHIIDRIKQSYKIMPKASIFDPDFGKEERLAEVESQLSVGGSWKLQDTDQDTLGFTKEYDSGVHQTFKGVDAGKVTLSVAVREKMMSSAIAKIRKIEPKIEYYEFRTNLTTEKLGVKKGYQFLGFSS